MNSAKRVREALKLIGALVFGAVFSEILMNALELSFSLLGDTLRAPVMVVVAIVSAIGFLVCTTSLIQDWRKERQERKKGQQTTVVDDVDDLKALVTFTGNKETGGENYGLDKIRKQQSVPAALYLIASNDDVSKERARQICDEVTTKASGNQIANHCENVDFTSISDCLSAARNAINWMTKTLKIEPADIYFDITGGTKIASVAGLQAAKESGITAVYVLNQVKKGRTEAIRMIKIEGEG